MSCGPWKTPLYSCETMKMKKADDVLVLSWKWFLSRRPAPPNSLRNPWVPRPHRKNCRSRKRHAILKTRCLLSQKPHLRWHFRQSKEWKEGIQCRSACFSSLLPRICVQTHSLLKNFQVIFSVSRDPCGCVDSTWNSWNMIFLPWLLV